MSEEQAERLIKAVERVGAKLDDIAFVMIIMIPIIAGAMVVFR